MRMTTMTKYVVSIFTLTAAATLTACGTKHEQNTTTRANPEQQEQVVIAEVPQPRNCLQTGTNRPGSQNHYGSAAQGQGWGPYARSGFVPYSWSYNGGWQTQQHGYQQGYPTQTANQYWNTNGFCGCPGGYIPACDGSIGLVCAPVANNNPYRYAAYGWGGNGSFVFSGYFAYSNGMSFGWSTGHTPTYAYNYGRYSQQRTCHMQVSQSCMVGTNSCGYGACMPTAAGSPYGVCVNH